MSKVIVVIGSGTGARSSSLRPGALALQTRSGPSAPCSWARTAPLSPAATSSWTAGSPPPTSTASSRRRDHLRAAPRVALTVADVASAAVREGGVDAGVACRTGSPPPRGALAPAHLSRGGGARRAARTCASAAMSLPRQARALRLPTARRTDGGDPRPSRGARAGRHRPERSVAARPPGPTPPRGEPALSRTRHPCRSRAGRGTVRL